MFQVCIRVLIFILLPGMVLATTSFELGKQYERLPSSIRSNPDVLRLIDENPGKTQVLLFFSYACHACSRLDQDFYTWADSQKGKQVAIYRYPAIFNKAYEILARTYYTNESLPNARQLGDDVYDTWHNKGVNLSKEDNLHNFFSSHGVTLDNFFGIYNSFGLDMKIKRARELGIAFNITVTPYVIVNSATASYGTNWAMAGSKENLFAILNYLISKDAPQTTIIE
jgi:thiol:disulfide interchange protein DsbA